MKKFLAVSLFVIVLLSSFIQSHPVYAQTKKIQKIKFTQQELTWIKQHPKVTVGTVSDIEPVLIINKNGDYDGILPEILAILSEHTGINFRITSYPSWHEMFSAGEKKSLDVLGTITPNKKSRKYFNYTRAIFDTHFYIFGSSDQDIQGFTVNKLFGKQVGYIRSTRIIESWIPDYPEIKLIPFRNQEKMLAAFSSGQVEFMIRAGVLEYWRQKNGVFTFKIIKTIDELDTNIVMGVRKDWPELTAIINKVLVASKTKPRIIYEHWLGYNINKSATNNRVKLTKEEKAWINQHPVIRTGFDPAWAPMEFLGDDGQPQGLSIQYLHTLEKSLGIRFEFIQNRSWAEAQKKLQLAQLDVLPDVSNNYPKRNLFHLTSPYTSVTKGIFSAKAETYLGGGEALKGKRIVVVEGASVQAWFNQKYPEVTVDTAPDIMTALKVIASGKAFAFVDNHLMTSYYIAKSGLTQIRMVGEIPQKHILTMAVRKDWEILRNILQKGLDAIPQYKRDAIYNNWVSIKYKQSIDYTLLWQVLAISLVLILTIIYWNRRQAHEIAQRIDIENKLKSAKKEAEKATRAKSEFLSNMSHEIRTPLNAVIGIGHLIRQQNLTQQQLTDYLDKMSFASESLLELIDTILDFSKAEAGKLSIENIKFSLGAVLQKISHELEDKAKKKGLNLNIQINSGTLDYLVGDPHKLTQIIRNLSFNAIKFTEKGEVKISVDLLECNSQKAKIRFAIADTGIGISLDQQEKLFKPFSQGDSSISRRYGGTGLGLVISQQIASLMGGEITFKSTDGGGSTFYFIATFQNAELRSQKRKPSTVQSPAPISPVTELTGTKVLLVEDDEINQWLAKKFLLAMGTRVETAKHGKAALELLDKQSFDIVLMDLQMPEMDGYEAVKLIRKKEKWVNLPIIAMTAHALSTEKDKCLRAGMNDYLTKPINPTEIKEILIKWLVSAT